MLAALLCAAPVQAASVGTSVNFDFTGPGTISDPLNPGNTARFDDIAGAGSQATVSAWLGTDFDGLNPATVLHSQANYAQYGYSLSQNVKGLGACGGNTLKKCLKTDDEFAVGSHPQLGSEWMLLTVSDIMQFETLSLAPTNKNSGSIVVYSGNVDLSNPITQLKPSDFTSQLQFAYAKKSAVQMVDLLSLDQGNALLVKIEGGKTAITIKGMQSRSVPLPPAIWLMGSGLVMLAARARRQSA